MLSFLAVTEPEIKTAAVVVVMHWAAVFGGITAGTASVGAALRWVWKEIKGREANHDEQVARAVAERDSVLTERYDARCADLQRRLDDSLAAEKRAKQELESIRDEFYRSTLPLLEKVRSSLVDFADAERATAESLSVRIAELNERDDKLRLSVRANTAALKAHSCH